MSDPLIPCPTCGATMAMVRVGTLGVGWCSACAPEGFKPPQEPLDAIAESPAALREALEARTQEARDAKVSELLPVAELPDLTQFARWGPDDDIVN